MGDDKIKVLKNFNLETLFSLMHAILIRQLWNNFLELYDTMKDNRITGEAFQIKAKAWLKLFLKLSKGTLNSRNLIRNLYRPSDLTPYIHVLVYHVPELLDIHRHFGMNSFSCCAVEKKNH